MYYKLDSKVPRSGEDDTYYHFKDGLQFPGVKSWASGQHFQAALPTPIVVPITQIGPPSDEPVIPCPFNDANMCLATPEIVTALHSGGVNNIDVYPAILRDTVTGIEFQYFAVNIIGGLVKAADIDKSEWTNIEGEAKADTIFEKLVVDESKTHGLDIFRMYEDTGTILINERIKKVLEHIPFLTFLPVIRPKS